MVDLFPELKDMSEKDKVRKIARHTPCDQCSDCEGWRPSQEADVEDQCACEHDIYAHRTGNADDMDRQLKVALRIDELLKEKGKIDDYEYTDEDIASLRKQIKKFDDATTDISFSEASLSPSSLDADDMSLKRQREDSEDGDAKRLKESTAHSDEEASNAVKAEDEEGHRLLNEDALNVNGAVDAKDGFQDEEGNVKVCDTLPAEKKESAAMIEERKGEIELRVVRNDGTPESMILLTGLKNIFQKQLPKMPKEYIARLVNHRSMALIRPPMKVIGGICYRPFDEQEFAEIVFCAIASTEQVKGYGSHLMNHLKDYISSHTNMKHFLTYADNYAIGYFRKQGFTTEITLDRRKWVGYIKDYEGGTIMQCTIVPKVKYLKVHDILAIQRKAVYEKMKQKSTSHIVYPGIDMPLDKDGTRRIDPLEVPGVKESGWTQEMDLLSNRPRHPPHYNQMRHMVHELRSHKDAWPFLDPVNGEEVTDYYDVIKEAMDLTTLETNVETDAYTTMDEFVKDVQKIFDNCRLYNAESTSYAKCANRLESYFKQRLRVWTNDS